jgi:hypothetical protein
MTSSKIIMKIGKILFPPAGSYKVVHANNINKIDKSREVKDFIREGNKHDHLLSEDHNGTLSIEGKITHCSIKSCHRSHKYSYRTIQG